MLFSECSCHPDGAKEVPGYPRGGCGSVRPGTLCECKAKVMGKFCDMCAEVSATMQNGHHVLIMRSNTIFAWGNDG